MDWHNIYLGFLSAMFVFWNGVRILTYVPTIRKLMRPGASGRDYSLATWGSWVLSNGFFALYLWEHGGRQLNSMVLLNIGNTCMCLLTCWFILKLQHRARTARPAATRPICVAPLQRPSGRRNGTLFLTTRRAGPAAVLILTLAAIPTPAPAAPVIVDFGALGTSGIQPSPLVVGGLSAQAGAGGSLATFSANGLGVAGNDPFAVSNGSTVELDESILFRFLAGAASDVSFSSTVAFNLAGGSFQMNVEGFGVGGGSLGTVAFSGFDSFPNYDVSGFFNDVDLSGFRLFGNGSNAGLNVATVSFDPGVVVGAVPEPGVLALLLVAGAAAAAARRGVKGFKGSRLDPAQW